MDTMRKNLDIIFERSLKWRVLKRSFTSVEGVKVLLKNFRIYDPSNTGKIGRDDWVSALYETGLTIGISRAELGALFDKYKEQNSDWCDYKKFSFDIFFKHQNNISLTKSNINNVPNLYNNYNPTEVMTNSQMYNNNAFLNSSHSQKYLTNNLNNSMPLSNISSNLNINTSVNTSNNYENLRYKNIYSREYNKFEEVPFNTTYIGTHVNMVKSAVSYFQSKINTKNGLTYYRLILELKSKSSGDDRVYKSYLPIALQDVGVFYTQNELQNLYDALGVTEVTANYFSLSKLIQTIKEEMNDNRKNAVINSFNSICQKQNNTNGIISINTLKEIFNPENHPDVKNNRTNAKEICNQFYQALDIYSKLNNIVDMNLDQFIDFYSGISPSIYDDNYFSDIMNNVWSNDVKSSNNNYNNENKIQYQTSLTTPKKMYNNLDVNTFNINYNQNGKRNVIENNYSNYNNNFSIKDRANNNNSNVKVNLPLFYYNNNNNDNYGGLSKSTNFSENNNLNQNNNNAVFSPNPRTRYNQYYENTEPKQLNSQEEQNRNLYNSISLNNNEINNSQSPKSPSKKISNLINTDLNSISPLNNNSNIDITPIINKLREIFILRGLKSIFYFQRMLYVYDVNHTGDISFTNLQTIINTYNYNFSVEEINNLFQFYDKDNIGLIKYNILFNEIIGNLSPIRFSLVKKLFDDLPKNQNGCIDIDVLKNCFCASKHYDVINGNKTIDEVYGEFLECLEIYKTYNNNLKRGIGNELTYEDFCHFFEEISLEIRSDYLFSNLLQNCWRFN